MTRRKVILPNWSVNEENSNDKELLLKAFDDLSYGEIVVNIKHSGVTLTTLDENGELARIESSIIVDEKINKESLRAISEEQALKERINEESIRAISEEGHLDEKISDSFNSAITYTNDSLTLLLSGATEAFDTLKEVEDWINSHSGQTIDIIRDINGLSGNLLTLSGETVEFSGSTVKEIERLDATIGEFSAATEEHINRIDEVIANVSAITTENIERVDNDVRSVSGIVDTFSASTVSEIKRLDTDIAFVSGVVDSISAITTENIERIDGDVIFVSGAVVTLNGKTEEFSASTIAEISRLDEDIEVISGSVDTLNTEIVSFSASTVSEIERIDNDITYVSGAIVSISAITNMFSASTDMNIQRMNSDIITVGGNVTTLSAATKTNIDRIDTNISNLSAVTANFSASVETTIGKTLNDAKTYTDQQIDFIVSGASETFDTLKEVETWINNHSGETKDIISYINSLYASAHTHSNKALLDTYAQTETNLADAVAKKHEHSNKAVLDGITNDKVAAWDGVSGKVDKVNGKGLSTNDFTNELKSKLDGIAAGAEINVQSDWNATSGDALILNKPTLFSGNYNDLTNKPTIPNAVTDSTVAGWGYTKNSGTITGINMNGVSKGTSGVINLGTVITSLEGYATQTWVSNQGYLTAVPSEYVTETELSNKGYLTSIPSDYAKKSDIPSLNGYATQTWVGQQGFLTSIPSDYAKKSDIPSLNGYATQTWVGQQGYLTSVPSDYAKKSDIPSVDGFIKNISLAPSEEVLYIVGSTSKTGSTTSLNTSSAAVYMKSGNLYAESDERLKDFGDNVEVDFNKLAEIPKVYYTWKTDANNKQQIGTSAQKLREVYPEIVSENEDGKLAVSYERLSIIALAAVDKLHKENEELKDRLKRIEEKLGL